MPHSVAFVIYDAQARFFLEKFIFFVKTLYTTHSYIWTSCFSVKYSLFQTKAHLKNSNLWSCESVHSKSHKWILESKVWRFQNGITCCCGLQISWVHEFQSFGILLYKVLKKYFFQPEKCQIVFVTSRIEWNKSQILFSHEKLNIWVPLTKNPCLGHIRHCASRYF